jgi:hypothetical protein
LAMAVTIYNMHSRKIFLNFMINRLWTFEQIYKKN